MSLNINTVSGLYRGSACFLLCNGPSLRLAAPILKEAGVFTLGMNNGPIVIEPNLWICADEPDKFLRKIWTNPRITKIAPLVHATALTQADPTTGERLAVAACPGVFTYTRSTTFAPANWLLGDSVVWGVDKNNAVANAKGEVFDNNRSVMLAAVRVLISLGFHTIFIVGADFEMKTEDPYAFPETLRESEVAVNNRLFRFLNAAFTELNPTIEAAGVDIYNCTPGGGLTAFERLPLQDALQLYGNMNLNGEKTEGLYKKAPVTPPTYPDKATSLTQTYERRTVLDTTLLAEAIAEAETGKATIEVVYIGIPPTEPLYKMMQNEKLNGLAFAKRLSPAGRYGIVKANSTLYRIFFGGPETNPIWLVSDSFKAQIDKVLEAIVGVYPEVQPSLIKLKEDMLKAACTTCAQNRRAVNIIDLLATLDPNGRDSTILENALGKPLADAIAEGRYRGRLTMEGRRALRIDPRRIPGVIVVGKEFFDARAKDAKNATTSTSSTRQEGEVVDGTPPVS